MNIRIKFAGALILCILQGFAAYAATSIDFGDKSSSIKVVGLSSKIKIIPSQLVIDNGSIFECNGGSVLGSLLFVNANCTDLTETTSGGGTIFLNGNDSYFGDPSEVNAGVIASNQNNRLSGFMRLNGAVCLQDLNTTLTIALVNTLNQNIKLRNGTAILENDLGFADDVKFTGSGSVRFNGYRTTFGGAPLSWPDTILWDGANDLALNSKMTVTGIWYFAGVSRITGNGNLVDLTNGGSIWIKSGATLSLADAKLKGLGSGRIVFEDDTAQLRLSQVEVEMDGDITWTTGGVYVEGPTTIVTQNKTLTLSDLASMTVDNLALEYDTLDFGNENSIQPIKTADPNQKFIAYVNNGVIRKVVTERVLTTHSNAMLYLTKNNSNALISCCKNNSNALLAGDKNNSNTILYLTKNNSNAILAGDKNNSNASLFCCKNISNALLWLTTNTNGPVFTAIRNNSDALLTLNKNNSNALLSCCNNNSNALLYLTKNNSNALLAGDKNNSNASLYCCKNLSNALLWLTTNTNGPVFTAINNNSNALLFLTKNNSNALIACCKNNSNAALFGITNNSNALLFLTKNNSNALIACCKNNSNAALFGITNNSNALLFLTKNNSNALIACCKNNSNAALFGITNNSNALLFLTKNNSNALIACCKNNSNAALFGITNNSNALLFLTKNNSNALIACCKNNSNAALFGITNNSNAILAGDKNNSNTILYLTKNLSNALLFCCKNSSNAILAGDKNNSNTLLYLTKNNSNALIACCKNNSNAALFGITNNSNALLFLTKNNSNALISCCKNNSNSLLFLTTNNSNALLYLTKNNSNALISCCKNNSNTLLFLAKNNSNALISCCKNNSNTLLYLNKNNSNALLFLTKNNSNTLLYCCKNNSMAIVWLDAQLDTIDHGPWGVQIDTAPTYTLSFDIFLSSSHTLLVTVDTTINGSGHAIKFARKQSNQFRIQPGVTVTLENVVLRDFDDEAINLMQDPMLGTAQIIFGNCTKVELSECQDLTKTWTFVGETLLYGDGNVLNFANKNIHLLQPGHLTIQDLALTNLRGSNLDCVGPNAHLIFKGSTLHLSSDYIFSVGSMRFIEENIITGTSAFVYTSTGYSMVNGNATLVFDKGLTFSYAPASADRDLIALQNATSRLFFDGCSVVSSVAGMRLTRGTLCIDHNNFLYNNGAVSASEGFAFGNGNSDDDLNLQIMPGASLEVVTGFLDYANVDA
ncbi:hypothetical protein JST56_01645 [Candidatus Dependentiae bacterium]|jgi:general stress protein 26|nr:hypothetical protein [Candidatus Dependentiae bacterium]